MTGTWEVEEIRLADYTILDPWLAVEATGAVKRMEPLVMSGWLGTEKAG